MKNAAPLVLAFFGFFVLLLTLPEGLVLSVMTAVTDKHAIELKGDAANLTLAMTGFGVLAMVVGAVRYAMLVGHDRIWGPYESALARLAMEHGQGIFKQPGGGIGFDSAREGKRLEVRLTTGKPQLIFMRQGVPARQQLLFVKKDAVVPEGYGHYREVGEGRTWELLAELPALARAHLNDVSLAQRMDRFFELRESLYVSHTPVGIEVCCELPPATIVGQRAREGLDVLAYLRQVNG